MTGMYKGVVSGQTPQVSLLKAQRDFVSQERKAGRWLHPYYWAAFVASGCGDGFDGPTLKQAR